MNDRRITRMTSIGVRTRLALGTALATAMFGYGHRSAYAACVSAGPPGTYAC